MGTHANNYATDDNWFSNECGQLLLEGNHSLVPRPHPAHTRRVGSGHKTRQPCNQEAELKLLCLDGSFFMSYLSVVIRTVKHFYAYIVCAVLHRPHRLQDIVGKMVQDIGTV